MREDRGREEEGKKKGEGREEEGKRGGSRTEQTLSFSILPFSLPSPFPRQCAI